MTFVDWDDIPRWGLIDRALDLGIPEPVETYSSSPHLYTDLNIPEGTKGRLPKDKQVRAGLGAEVLEDLGETGKRGGSSRGQGSHGGSGRSGHRSDDGARDGRSRGRGGRGGSERRQPGDTGSGSTGPKATTASAGPDAGSQAPSSGEGGERTRTRRRTRRRRPGGSAEGGAAAPSGE